MKAVRFLRFLEAGAHLLASASSLPRTSEGNGVVHRRKRLTAGVLESDDDFLQFKGHRKHPFDTDLLLTLVDGRRMRVDKETGRPETHGIGLMEPTPAGTVVSTAGLVGSVLSSGVVSAFLARAVWARRIRRRQGTVGLAENKGKDPSQGSQKNCPVANQPHDRTGKPK
jgi:hypothetical protein